MKESYGTSSSGNLKEAVRGLGNPAFLILMSNAEQLEAHAAELEELYPGVPSIGCIGMSYQTGVTEKGVSVTAFEGDRRIRAGIHHAGQIYQQGRKGFTEDKCVI